MLNENHMKHFSTISGCPQDNELSDVAYFFSWAVFLTFFFGVVSKNLVHHQSQLMIFWDILIILH